MQIKCQSILRGTPNAPQAYKYQQSTAHSLTCRMIKSFYNRGLVRTSTIQSSALVGAGVDSLRAARAGAGRGAEPALRREFYVHFCRCRGCILSIINFYKIQLFA